MATQVDDISVRDPGPSDPDELEPHDVEQEHPHLDQVDSRQWESKRKRACVLASSSMLQLPIWGRKFPYL